MTNDNDAEIKALEEALANAKAKARIKALQDEIDALKGETEPAADAPTEVVAAEVVEPEVVIAEVVEPEVVTPTAAPAAVAPAVVVQNTIVQPSAAGGGAGGSRGLLALLVVLILLLVASLAGTFFAIRGDLRAPWAAPAGPPTELALIPAGQFGPNPVLPADPEIVVYDEISTAVVAELPESVASLGVTEVSGGTAEIYGLGYGSCPTGGLEDALNADGALAAAWISALNTDETLNFGSGLTFADYESYSENLSIGVLLADTRVTFNGYGAGAIFPTQAVLQKGTPVMFDRFGVPRVHCSTGVPLTAAATGAGEITFSGTSWEGFSAGALARIAPVTAALSEVTVLPVGPSNVTTAFTYALGVCTAGVACAAPAPGDVRPALVAPPVLPTSAECSTLPAGATLDANGVNFRFVNATASQVFVTNVATADEGCQVRTWSDLRAGKAARGESVAGLIWLFSDGSSATASSQWVQTAEPTMWVIQ